jgi:hypothetical protein
MEVTTQKAFPGSFQPVIVETLLLSQLSGSAQVNEFEIKVPFLPSEGEVVNLQASFRGQIKTDGYIGTANTWSNELDLSLRVSEADAKDFGQAIGVNVEDERCFMQFKRDLVRKLDGVQVYDSNNTRFPHMHKSVVVGDQ